MKIETLTDYGTGGAVTTTIRYLSASDGTLQNGTVTETDGENLLRRLEMTGPGGEKLSLSFRCEEGEKDGQRVKYAYLDDITASGSEEVLERAAELETVKGQPYGEYLLDEKGRVSSCTLHQGLLTPEEEFSQEWSRLFDAAGRELRSEQRLQTADLLSITVTETEYR